MRVTIVDSIFVVVHGRRPPADGEWSDYLDRVLHEGKGMVQLVTTDGGGPTLAQRRALKALLGERHLPTAVWSELPLVRLRFGFAALVAGAWEEVVAFSSLSDALAHLELSTSRAMFLESTIARLRHADGGAP